MIPVFCSTTFTSGRDPVLISISLLTPDKKAPRLDLYLFDNFEVDTSDLKKSEIVKAFAKFEKYSAFSPFKYSHVTVVEASGLLHNYIASIQSTVMIYCYVPVYDFLFLRLLLKGRWPKNLINNTFYTAGDIVISRGTKYKYKSEVAKIVQNDEATASYRVSSAYATRSVLQWVMSDFRYINDGHEPRDNLKFAEVGYLESIRELKFK